jgi:prophage regulatory protein
VERSNKERILRLADVKVRTGKSRSSIYLEMTQGTFPKHISLGVRTVGWIESEIDAWIAARIEKSRKHARKSAEV